jgi:long-chain acyl-CoA synthetase
LPVETANAFEDGWFKTGDVGYIDEAEFLYITDRKKDLIKTSGGKYIAPQPIEGTLKSNLLVAEAAIIGDRRKFPMVVISPNFPALEEWAVAQGLVKVAHAELVDHPAVQALYKDIVDGVNQNLAQFEKIKKVLLVPDEFTVANGALTPTMKLKRRVVEERYRERLEQMYAPVGSGEPLGRA